MEEKKQKEKKKPSFGKAVVVGMETTLKNLKKYMEKAPERAKAAHNNKLEALARREKELEAGNKVLKLEKERDELRPKDKPQSIFGQSTGGSDPFDKLI